MMTMAKLPQPTPAACGGLEICIGSVESVPPGEGKTFQVAGGTVAVFRGRDGSLRAVDNACPHKGGPLAEGLVGGCTVICPMHSWKFDLTTGACLTDPAYHLRTYPLREEDGLLLLTLE